jgi:hypothetical protein
MLISLSLFRDAIVQFIGCFDKSAKAHLDAYQISDDNGRGLKFFEWMKDIRDSYAAHKFGPLRQCITGVQIDEKGNIVQPLYSHQIYSGPARDSRKELLNIVYRAGIHTQSKVNSLVSQLEEYARGLDKKELLALKAARLREVEPHQFRSSREKFFHGPALEEGE